MKNILILIGLLLPITLIGQTWQWAKHIGGPGMETALIGHIDNQHNIYLYGKYAVSYAATNYNNCYIENDTLFGQSDAFLAKYDENGNLLWVKNCVSPYGSTSFSFTFDTLNNVIYISGSYDIICNIDTCTIYSGYYYTGFIAKLDTSGNCIWAKNITTPSFVTTTGGPLTTDSNGNIYIGGTTNATNIIDTSTITPGTFLAKFDSDGNNLWAKTKVSWTGSGSQSQMRFNSLKYFNNNIYASGTAYAASLNDTIRADTISLTNIYGNAYGLICMDANNSTAKWLKFEGIPNVNTTHPMMAIDNNGNIYCAGAFHGTCKFSQDTLTTNSFSDGFLSKYNSNGDLQYVKQMYSSVGIAAVAVSTLIDGTVCVSGAVSGQGILGTFTINSNTNYDLFIARYDNNGDCLGVSHAGIGAGLSIAGTENGLYVAGVFPPQGTISGIISIGNYTFTNYGWTDIIFAKHDMFTGLGGEGRLANNQLVIYANPNKGSFKLKIPDEFAHEPNLTLNIFDSSGKLISQQQLKLSEDHPVLNIFGQPAGSYNVTLTNGKKIYYGRMVVE